MKNPIEVDLNSLRVTETLPCYPWLSLVLILGFDVFNQTGDVNKTNNYAILPVDHECDPGQV